MQDNNWKQQKAKADAREAVYACIADYLDENGVSPEMSDVVKGTGLSLASVKRHVAQLITDGRLIRRNRRQRNLEPR